MKNINSHSLEEIEKLAKVADYAGHSATAFELFKNLIKLDPGNNKAIYRAVKNLLEIGRITDAELFLNKIRPNAAPKPWLMEVVLGQLRVAQFRPSEAETHFRNAWKFGSNSTAPAIYLADFLTKVEKFNDANDVLLEALKIDGDIDEVYLNLGAVKRAMGDYSSARDCFLMALKITPDYPNAKRGLADVEMWLGLAPTS